MLIGGRGMIGNQATPDEKLASFKEKYADYLARFNVVPEQHKRYDLRKPHD